jgi:hypothetical protein
MQHMALSSSAKADDPAIRGWYARCGHEVLDARLRGHDT